jgi:hypothetical protein
MSERTSVEEKAIRSLRRLAKQWPDTLWLYAASGRLHVMKKKDGEIPVTSSGGVDDAFSLGSIDIQCDGGDW